jgi:hypothetical protein
VIKFFATLIISLPLVAHAARAQVLVVPPISEMSEQQLSDETSALNYYFDTLTTLEALKFITETARGSTRPSDLVEGVSEAEGSGRLMRGVSDSLKQLAENSTLQRPAWADRWERANDATGLIRKLAATVNMTAEFLDAVDNADTSSAEEKLKSLANLIDNINTIVSPKTPVGAYVSVVADIVEGIAHDAAIIEDATKQKNEAIALVRQLLVGEVYEDVPDDLAAMRIAEIEARIEEIERLEARRLSEVDYRRLVSAESVCAQRRNLSRQQISELRRERAAVDRAIRNNATVRDIDAGIVFELKSRITSADLNLADALADQTGTDPLKALNAEHRVVRFETESAMYKAELAQIELSVAERKVQLDSELVEAQRRATNIQNFFASYDECVRNILRKTGKIVDVSYATSVRSDGAKEATYIAVSGFFKYPVVTILRPKSCSSGVSCNTENRTIDEASGNSTLVSEGVLWCSGVTGNVNFDYETLFVDADGYESNVVDVKFVCTGS